MNHLIRLDDIIVGVEHPKANWRASKMRNSASFAIGAVVLLAPFAASLVEKHFNSWESRFAQVSRRRLSAMAANFRNFRVTTNGDAD